MVVDHQKIVFTATLSATLTLTNAPLRSSQKRAEAGSGLDDRIISTPLRALLPGSHLTAATPESVRREGVLTDGENGETDQKVNKYLQKNAYSPNQVQIGSPHIQYASSFINRYYSLLNWRQDFTAL